MNVCIPSSVYPMPDEMMGIPVGGPVPPRLYFLTFEAGFTLPQNDFRGRRRPSTSFRVTG